MAPPFEVAIPRSELYSSLLVLRRATVAGGIYRRFDLRRHVVSFFWRKTFYSLAEAVEAAVHAERTVRVTRNATLPGPLHGLEPRTWCLIPPGAAVFITAKTTPCRLRHLGDNDTCVFAISNGAVLTISGLTFKAIPPSYHPAGSWRNPHSYFAMVLPDANRAGRLEVTSDVRFEGYDEILHEAAEAREIRLLAGSS